MKKFLSILAAIVALPLASSCSVYMAAKGNDGVEPTSLVRCKSRTCLIAEGAKPVMQYKNKKGQLTGETFYAKRPTGSAARAAVHGVLDVATLGLWEVAGTPIEGIANKSDGYELKVTYAGDSETITSAQIFVN